MTKQQFAIHLATKATANNPTCLGDSVDCLYCMPAAFKYLGGTNEYCVHYLLSYTFLSHNPGFQKQKNTKQAVDQLLSNYPELQI